METIFLFFESLRVFPFFYFLNRLEFFHVWDPMCAHDAVSLHHSTHVQVNPKPIPFSKGGMIFESF